MPTREQLEKLNGAKQKMATGERALRDFVDRPDKKGTANERQTHKDLADQSRKAMTNMFGHCSTHMGLRTERRRVDERRSQSLSIVDAYLG